MTKYIETLLAGEEVEWKTLGEVAEIKKGKQLNKTALTETGLYPAYNGGISHSGFTNTHNYKANTIIVSQGGASAGFVNFITVPFYANAHCYVILPDSSAVINKYVYYFLKNKQESLMSKQLGAGIPALKTSGLLEIVIPIPSLRVQRKIVEVLDNFTELTAELTLKLTAELTARRKQYEYYRNELLSFKNVNAEGGGITNVKFLPLGEVAKYVSTRVANPILSADNYIGVENLLPGCAGKVKSNYVPIQGKSIEYNVGDILLGNIRPYLKKIWFSDSYGGASNDVLVIRVAEKSLSPRYLYYILSSQTFFDYNMQYAKGAKMPRGNKQSILMYPIPIPPIEEQRRIVEILDQFDTLTQSITEGLPREIELRRKQYEYYREQLLSFN